MTLSAPDRLDEVIDAAIDSQPAEREAPARSSLDELLTNAIEKKEQELSDFEDFRASRKIRDDLSHIGKPDELMNHFLDTDKRMREDPVREADALASRYLQFGYGATRPTRAKAEEHATALDATIEASYQAAEDKRLFEETRASRERLKQVYPELSYTDALKRLNSMHEDLIADPLSAGTRIAAAYGMPVTQTQHQQVGAFQLIDTARERLPRFMDLENEIIDILQNPTFRQNIGNAPQAEKLQKAYQIALKLEVDGVFSKYGKAS